MIAGQQKPMFSARSASDRDETGFWYVRRHGSDLNVTEEALVVANWQHDPGAVFLLREQAIALAEAANKAEGHAVSGANHCPSADASGLLELLKAAEEVIAFSISYCGSDKAVATLASVRAAITKAEGRT